MRNLCNRGHVFLMSAAAFVITLLLSSAPVFRCPPVHAGLVIEEKNDIHGLPSSQGSGQETSRTRTSKTYIEGKKVRTESGATVVIIDFDKRVLYNLKPEARTYTEMTLEQLQQAQKDTMKWVNDMKGQMQQNLDKVSPESRKELMKKLDAISAMTAEQQPVKVSVKATGKKQTINGYPCEGYEVSENGEKAAVSWVTSSISTKEFDAYQKEMNKWMADFAPSVSNRMEEWKYLHEKGFPIKTTRLKPAVGKISVDREVTHIETQSFSDSLFQPPEDYRREELPQPRKPMPATK